MSEPSECTFDACESVLDLAKEASVIAGSNPSDPCLDELKLDAHAR
jgi:hypothetical protein